MTSTRLILASLLVFSTLTGVLVPARANATVPDPEAATPPSAPPVERVQPLLLADVVVNGQQAPAPAPAPAPVAPVVVEPQPAPPPVVEPRHSTTVIEHEPRNFMSTIAVSALMGGIAGLLVGGAIYYVGDNQTHANRILYWGAGGVLVGTGVGIVQVVTEETRLDRATATTLPTDPVPTYRLALCRMRF
jgi:hypothetical protein